MSYDLHIASPRRVRSTDLDAFLAAAPQPLNISGRLQTGGSLLIRGGDVSVELDGPFRLEPDDVPDAAGGVIRRSGWLVTLSAKPSTDAVWPHALAEHLARTTDGVVYDPQHDAVTWPRGWQPRAQSDRSETVDVVAVNWFITRSEPDRAAPAILLDLLRRHFPVALPKRYGMMEPLQHRFEGDGADAGFSAFWHEVAADPLGMGFWTSTRPCLGGTVTMTPPVAITRGGIPFVAISMTVDSRPLFRDPALLERFVRLFVDAAEQLDCTYATGSLTRGFILRSGNWSGGGEVSPVPFGQSWVGLPASPTWLAWFGPPYATLVADSVAGQFETASERGLFLRAGAEPMNADEVADVFPQLPARLLARRRGRQGEWLPRQRYTMGSPPPSEPAEHLPDVS